MPLKFRQLGTFYKYYSGEVELHSLSEGRGSLSKSCPKQQHPSLCVSLTPVSTVQVVAPYPTVFIGGNHEAANYLWELYHGGWAAPNIYFMGYAGACAKPRPSPGGGCWSGWCGGVRHGGAAWGLGMLHYGFAAG